MKKLLMLLGLPLITLWIFEVFLFRLGENWTPLLVRKHQKLYKAVYNKRFTPINPEFKKWVTDKESFETIVMGSSRMLNINGSYFEGSFYNASLPVSRGGGWIFQMWEHYQSMNKNNLKNLVIGLDYWQFDPDNFWTRGTQMRFDRARFISGESEEKGLYPALMRQYYKIGVPIKDFYDRTTEFLTNRKSMYYGLITEDKINVLSFFNSKSKNVGLLAKFSGSGYLYDGSYWHPDEEKIFVPKLPPQKEAEKFLFRAPLYYLVMILADAKARGIEVTFIFPPVAPDYYKSVTSYENSHRFAFEAIDKFLCPFLYQNGGNCFNFSDLDKYKVPTALRNAFVDATHPKWMLMNFALNQIQPIQRFVVKEKAN